jgi:hypothetical protein
MELMDRKFNLESLRHLLSWRLSTTLESLSAILQSAVWDCIESGSPQYIGEKVVFQYHGYTVMGDSFYGYYSIIV